VRLLDWYIIRRFFANFMILFALMYLFAVAIDLLVSLDRFVSEARTVTGDDRTWLGVLWTSARLIVDFQTPRLFQFYSFLYGLLAVGAMGFTLAQMHRHKELVSIMAAGVGLHRVAMPFIGCAFLLGLVQLANGELILPRVAPLLLRDHGQIGSEQFQRFAVPFTRDGNDNLLQAAAMIPSSTGGTLTSLTFIVRDAEARTQQRITAERAMWDEVSQSWILEEGWRVQPASGGTSLREPAERITTDLTPEALTMRQHGQFASMLSLAQIQEMLQTPDVVDARALVRFKYARFSGVLTSVLVLALCLPTFLLREPVPLMPQTLKCAGIAVPATMGAAIGMMADLPGPPAASVFLPVIILGLLVLARWTWMKT